MDDGLIDRRAARDYLVAVVPDYEWLLRQIESDGGWVRFPRFLTDAISNLRIESYPLLYEKEAAIAAVFLRAFMDAKELGELNIALEAATAEERGSFVAAFTGEVAGELERVHIPKSAEEQQEAAKMLQALPDRRGLRSFERVGTSIALSSPCSDKRSR